MFIKQSKNPKTGRVTLSISYSYSVKGGSKHKQIVNLGFLDELEKKYDDPMAYARSVLEKTKEDFKTRSVLGTYELTTTSKLDKEEEIPVDQRLCKNFGSVVLSKVYHELGIHEFMNNRRRYTKAAYNHNVIFQMLIYNRILTPDSKKGAWENRGSWFMKTDYSIDDVYHSLDFFLHYREDLMKKIHESITKQYKRNTLLMYYDVTNYYFESDVTDELRQKGVSKNHSPHPIIQMGLFMDERGLPVSYNLFAGNNNDCTTLPKMIDDTFDKFDISNLIVVGDKGMMSANNIAKIRLQHNGYVISHSPKKASEEFVKYILDDTDYVELYDEHTGQLVFKYKSRYSPREIYVIQIDNKTNEPILKADGKPKTVKSVINERQVVFYSEKYAQRQRFKRDKALKKAEMLMGKISKDGMTVNFGAAKYIRKDPIDKKTKQRLDDKHYIISLDEKKIQEEALVDGYYILCTNVVGLEEGERSFNKKCRYTKDGFFQLNKKVDEQDIIEMYRGLWKIEETFKVTKSDLKSRPAFVWTLNHIRAHFLICYVSLVILRLIQYRLKWKYSATEIREQLLLVVGRRQANNYQFSYFSQTLEDIGNEFGIEFDREALSQKEIKHIFGNSKV